jgi:7,8-dihydro-6-hydroxymethylpterin dimethyltransferase
MDNGNVLYKTLSICPVCMTRIPAERVRKGNEVFLRKTCDLHGTFETIIWRGHLDFTEWTGGHDPEDVRNLECPDKCGLCENHLQKTCCVLINITDNCNLDCEFCLADQCNGKNDPSFEDICESFRKVVEKGKTLVQLSGGEPTTREDLPEIIKAAKQAGAKYVQLNTNGIRLAEDIDLVRRLAEAGLSFVFMQFDGTEDNIHKKLRNRKLLGIKQQAIDNCGQYNLGVTLVPTIVRGVNPGNIGEIIRFAISQSPKVRGVHFQPVSYFGRMPGLPANDDRFTLDELVREIHNQTGGAVKPDGLLPSCCDHPLCGFHGAFVVDELRRIAPLSKRSELAAVCCCDPMAAEKNREFVARRWQRPLNEDGIKDSGPGNLQDMEYFLKRVKTHGFTITAMAFQDAGNIDFARLQHCSFHVYNNGKLVPFCANYLSPWQM